MADKKYMSSYLFEPSFEDGEMKGGGYWLSHDLNRFNNKSWKGIVIDAYGDLLGLVAQTRASNQGITVWTDDTDPTKPSHKDLQIHYSQSGSGITIYGGQSGWFPHNYVYEDHRTWSGVIINASGILCYKGAATETGDAKLKLQLNQDGISLYGGALVWVPEDYDPEHPRGFLISYEAILAYDDYKIGENFEPVFELRSTGYLRIGHSDKGHVVYDIDTSNIWTFGVNIVCVATNFDKDDPLTHNGVIINSTGLYGYEYGKERVKIGSNGSITIIGGNSGWYAEGYIEGQYDTYKGIAINSLGIFGFIGGEAGFVSLQILQSGNIVLGRDDILGIGDGTVYPQLRYEVDSHFLWMRGATIVCTNTDFTNGDPLTYDGVVLDASGLWMCCDGEIHMFAKNDGTFYLGYSENSRLTYLPSTSALVLQGVNIVCADPGFIPGNTSTYNGVIINSDGIFTFVESECTLSIENDGNISIGRDGHGKLLYNNETLIMLGATICCIPGNFVSGLLDTYDGVIIDSTGLYAYNNSIKTVEISNDGSFKFGPSGKQISYNSIDGVLSYAGFVSQTMTPVDPSGSYTGVIIDNHGIKGYSNGVVIGGFTDTGYIYVGKVSVPNMSIVYDANADNLTIGKTVLINDLDGTVRQAGDIAKRVFLAINSTGQIIGEIPGTTLISGVSASSIAASAGEAAVTMDTIADGSTYKKITSGEKNDFSNTTYIVNNTMNSSGDATFRNLAATTLGGSGNRAVYSTSAGLFTNSSSDIKLKKDIQNIQYGIKDILKLKPVEFYWKNQLKFGTQKEIGFIAQEVQDIIPELIGINSDETLSLDYPKIIPVIVKAIQDLCEILSIKL